MPEINFDQLGIAGVTIALLLWGLKLALSKIEKHEATIENLHDRNAETLTETLKSQQESHSILSKAIDYFQHGRRDV